MTWHERDERGRRRRTFAGWEPSDSDPTDGLLVANGDHLIVQFETREDADGPADQGDEGPENPEPRGYMYGAMRLVAHDDEGRVTALESWPVQCGPLARNERTPTVTDRPFPGLTVIGDNCIAESADAVRGAAVLSEALGQHHTMRWIRDGWR